MSERTIKTAGDETPEITEAITETPATETPADAPELTPGQATASTVGDVLDV